MDREAYIDEVKRRLTLMFRASRDGYKAPATERHRLEGFMQAGIFLGLARKSELAQIMNEIHVEIFGKTIEERKSESAALWISEDVDYGQYEQPAYQRVRS
ncbi:hypothetical protein [Microbulbifer magnicolonia]|uniref:hypothetical protein n=1 Tax=Microbulbifer magnicolonia TaxID=3109744 RepID=UPI002B411825|nr:hypothetical protein [Microbulbifer sp. GG15]